MSRDPYLHEHDEFSALLNIISNKKDIPPQLIETDYWIMHCLFGLSQQGFQFELKGGTSLSKGFGIIDRFSEDIDIRIDPKMAPFEVMVGKNHVKPQHVQSRKDFYDWLADTLTIEGIVSVKRDEIFDDQPQYRSGGIRLHYETHFDKLEGHKEGILLEVGFDVTTPNEAVMISSWAFDEAINSSVTVFNNQAKEVNCYHPGYTFVEKLQAVSTKFRQQQGAGEFTTNFLRHYYDLAQLLDCPTVQSFIGTQEYHEKKTERFRGADNQDIASNEAFLLSDADTRQRYKKEFLSSGTLYYQGQPDFDVILEKIQSHIETL